MEALSSLETVLHAGLVAVAVAVASWSAWRSFSTVRATETFTSKNTGELAWTVVAVAVLTGVSFAAGIGIGRGF